MENKKSLILVLCIAVSLFGHTALIGYDIPYEMRPAEALLLEQEMNGQEIQDI